MDDELVDYALARILDDIRIGEWATGEVDKRLKRSGPQVTSFGRCTRQSRTSCWMRSVKRTSRAPDLITANDQTSPQEWGTS
jgi:hypothetical protein